MQRVGHLTEDFRWLRLSPKCRATPYHVAMKEQARRGSTPQQRPDVPVENWVLSSWYTAERVVGAKETIRK
jgi:hypothetical protein